MAADSANITAKVNEYLSFDEAVAYGPTHALWKALDEDQPLEVLIGIIEDGERGFGGAKGVSKGTKYTPLHCAAQRNNLPLARYLLEKGTDVNAKTYEDFTALDFAEHSMQAPEMVALLREHGGE